MKEWELRRNGVAEFARNYLKGVFVAEQKLEYWYFVKCKSLECDCRILLGKFGDVQPFRFPLGALPPDALCADWPEQCPECLVTHTYKKSDVLVSEPIDAKEIPVGATSAAFRRARS